MTEKQIVINNLLINYYVAGGNQGSGGKPVIFLHGWRSNGMIWTPIVRLMFEQNYNIYCLDLPGFGKSEFPQKPFHLHEYAEIVKEFIEKLGLVPSLNPSPLVGEGKGMGVILVGHSFGGRVAIKLAALYPDLIKKLVLVDCGGFRKSEWKRGFITFLARVTKPAFALPLLRTLRPRIYNMLGAEDYLAIPELKSTFLNIISEDLTEFLPGVEQETLIIWGENDQEAPLEFGELMHGRIPNSAFYILKNAGHFSFLDKPEEFVKVLSDFLKT